MVKRLRAVALFVTNPAGEILILQEFVDKPHIGKLAGMYSIPMETCEPGESYCSTLGQLHVQELPDLSLALPFVYTGAYRVAPGVWAKLYATTVETDRLPSLPCHGLEVGNHQWVAPQEAVRLWLRQGAFEMIHDRIAGHRDVVCLECRPPCSAPV